MRASIRPEDARIRQMLLAEINPSFSASEFAADGKALSRRGVSLGVVMDLLKQASSHPKGPLAALEIAWENPQKSKPNHRPAWVTIMHLLMKADAEDGLFLIDALIKTLPSKKHVRHELCSLVMGQTEWRIRAIERNPHLFAPSLKPGFLPYPWSASHRKDAWDGNAFVSLAVLESFKSTKENVLETIVALEKIGAPAPGLSKDKGQTVLHWAAARAGFGTAQCLSAFAEHFSDMIDAKDRDGFTPLHIAAINSCTENIAALLKAGAKTTSLGNMGDSPLDEAVKTKNIDVVKAMCTHGEHDWACLKRAKSWAMNSNIRGYLDSQLAKLAIDEMLSKSQCLSLA